MVDCCGCCKCIDVGPGPESGKETYCGPITLLIGLFLCPFICCCPLDVREKTAYEATGTRIIEF